MVITHCIPLAVAAAADIQIQIVNTIPGPSLTICALSNTINGLRTTLTYVYSIYVYSDPKLSVDKRPTINIYQAWLLAAVRRGSRHDKNIEIPINNTHSQHS